MTDDGLWQLPDSALSSVPVGRGRVQDSALAPDARAIDLFWDKVVKSPTCHYWIGSISSPDGYGRFNYQRRSRQRTVLAHRFAVELVHGPLTVGLVCEHKCNEPLCVRVGSDHLIISTYRENVRYAIALGRQAGPHSPDGGTRSRYQRSVDIRDALIDGYDAAALRAAKTRADPGQQALF